MNQSGSDTFCLGMLLIIGVTYLMGICLFLLFWVLADCVFQEMGPVYLGYQIHVHKILLQYCSVFNAMCLVLCVYVICFQNIVRDNYKIM